MLAVLLVSLAVAQPTAAPDTVPDRVAPELDRTAYVDASARDLVFRARARQESTANEIAEYRAVARERISLGLQTLGRERLFFRRELAARIHWRRDAPGTIEILGARQVMPALTGRMSVPGSELRSEGLSLPFDPAGEGLLDALLGGGSEAGINIGGDGWFKHPLAAGSEAHYRFRSGDTTQLRLHDGTTVRLYELHVLPRRRDSQLVGGTLWLDADSYQPVRMVARLARAFDLDLDSKRLDPQDANDVPRLFKPVRADLRLLTVEYALWHDERPGGTGRWWLPRLIAVDGIGEVNMLPSFPVRFERVYSEMQVVGSASALARGEVLEDAAGVAKRCPRRRRSADGEAAAAPELSCICTDGQCRLYEVAIPSDTAALLYSEYLPPSPFATGELLVSGEQIDALAEQLRRLAPTPWGVQPPLVRWTVLRGDLTRFNRVEGLSVGASVEADFGAFGVDASARLGVADLEPGGELGVWREGHARRATAAAYRRLVPVDPASRPLGLGNSAAALFFGVDDGDYYRTLGFELRGRPTGKRRLAYDWRLFAERQDAAHVGTDWSLAGMLGGEREVRPNVEAERADQLGFAVELRGQRGLDPDGFRADAAVELEVATGSFAYARPSAVLGAGISLPGPYIGRVEVAAGTTFGDVPVQRLHYLGGRGSVRGYPGAAAAGEAFWRGRAEVSNSLPGARLVLFTDAGWAGPRAEVELDPALVSAGVGASFFDGLIRVDLARALRGATGWRFILQTDAGL
jgi:hypothetical protein